MNKANEAALAKQNMVIALVGNQNTGKTTLFNALTGANQRVGNFPGVTVEKKEGALRSHPEVTIVDLPGIYSISPYSAEEIVTRDFIIDQKPDAIIDIVDATNLERNLYLSLQLMELGTPVVIALNMMDEVRASGTFIAVDVLSKELGVPLVPISAARGEGVVELADRVLQAAKEKQLPKITDFCEGPVHRAIHAMGYLVEDHAEKAGVPMRFAGTKLIEGDEPVAQRLGLSQNHRDTMEHIIEDLERECGTDREAAMADMRYAFIEKAVAAGVTKKGENPAAARSVAADKILTHPVLGIPLFIGVMVLTFWISFGPIGSFFSGQFEEGITAVTKQIGLLLEGSGVNPVVRGLIVDGALTGVGSVLSFLPLIVLLFLCLSLLEDSGYMARVAFVMDQLLRKIGLSGRSIVPMLIGFGCTVPAIMATRTLSSERDRKMTILLVPFASCGAKIPIYAMFAKTFFPGKEALVMGGLYLGGILLGILWGLIFKNTLFKGEAVPFVMELPNYRLPDFRTVLRLVWEKAKDFITKAFTIIFVASIVVWVLQTFSPALHVVENGENSILGIASKAVAPVFAPLGFADWRAVSALVGGFSAKEAVISTLAVLVGVEQDQLPMILSQMFTPLSAISFLVFTLLYTPCMAAVAATKRELNSFAAAMGVMIFQTGFAWVAAFVVYQVGALFLRV